MAKTIGSFDLASLKNLRDDVTQYFWFESDSSSAWGSGAHVTLYPESQFTNSTSPNYMKGQNIIMNTDGFSIRNGGLPMMVLDNNSLDFNVVDTSEGTYVTTATFANTGAQIGQDNESHLEIDYHSLKLIDRDDNEYLYISDLRDANGYAQITETFEGDGVKRAFNLAFQIYYSSPDYVSIVTINEVVQIYGTDYTFPIGTPQYISFTTAPSDGSTIVVTYFTDSNRTKAYTLGKRLSTSRIGAYSFSEGYDTEASGGYSHAEGFNSTASGKLSHAEGSYSIANGTICHAEGGRTTANGHVGAHAEGYYTTASGDYGAHAEGDHTTASGVSAHAEGSYTIASGNYSHAGGYGTIASGKYSHAGGYHTIAQRNSQIVIGKYNIADTDGEDEASLGNYAFIIGNGTADDARSNALTVDWNGNVVANGTIEASNSTPSISITTSTGTRVSSTIRRFGNVVQLLMTVQNSSSIAQGGNIYEGTITTTALRPIMTTTGGSYYSTSAITGTISTTGDIVIRNEGDSKSFTSNCNISFTYIVA